MEQKRYKIKLIDHIKKDGHTEYTLLIENDNEKFSFAERYSILKKLNDIMKKESNNNNQFPKFPPRKFFGSEDEKFIIKRQQEINIFFDVICNNPNFSKLPSLIKFIEEKKKKGEVSNDKNYDHVQAEQVKPKNIIEDVSQKKEPQIMTSTEVRKKEEEFNKIVNEFCQQFYDVNNYYDKDMINDNDKYIKFFENNNIKNDGISFLAPSDDSNFNLIGINDDDFESNEIRNKNKLNNVINLWNNINEKYDTKGLIVPL